MAHPKNFESRTGPPPLSSLSLSLDECLVFDLDLCFLFSFLDLFDLDFNLDLFESLTSSSLSLLEYSEDELSDELDSDDLLFCKMMREKNNERLMWIN